MLDHITCYHCVLPTIYGLSVCVAMDTRSVVDTEYKGISKDHNMNTEENYIGAKTEPNVRYASVNSHRPDISR